jgi:hypothetical protein
MKTKQLLEAFMAIGVLGGAASLLQPTEVFAQSSATVGNLRGIIRDKATGEPAVGATVVATSPALVGEQVVITDENGAYFITALPPGLYTLTIYHLNQPFARPGVLIQLGKEAVVNVTVDSAAAAGRPGGEVIEIKGTVPVIDQGSTKLGFTLTDDYTRNIPTGRTFAGSLGAAAGSQGDQFGVSLSGATSPENIYVIDGINTTDTGFGGVSSNLPNEFIAETEIITGGYNAEFGRATGGIINVVTKQGSNQFRGSVFGYVTPGALVAAAEPIQRQGAAIDLERNLDLAYDVGAEVGGPIIKDKLWFHVGFNPSSNRITTTRYLATRVDRDQDGVPDIDPDTGFLVHDRIAGTERDFTSDLTTYFFTAKINGAVDQNHQFQISTFGNPRVGEAVVGDMVRNPEFTRFDNSDGAYDVAAKWTSKFNDGRTQLDAVVGFHRGYDNVSPFPGQNVPGIRLRAGRQLSEFAAFEGGNLAACDDASPNDPYPLIANCPVNGYALQGFGTFEQRTNDRTSAVLAVTQRVNTKKAGYHTFKAGIDTDFATYDSTRFLSGGSFLTQSNLLGSRPPDQQTPRYQLRENLRIVQNINRNMLDADGDGVPDDANMNGIPDVIEMVAPGDPNATLCINDNAVCTPADQIIADTRNSSLAFFVQDSWQIRPNLTLNLGVRWERQTGGVAKALQGTISPEGEVIPDTAYTLTNMIAPRLGFIYDPTQEGKSKIFGHWGRFYENVPMDMNVRAFGGEITQFTFINPARRSPEDPAFDPACNVDYPAVQPGDIPAALSQCSQRALQAQIGGGTEYVSPGLRGQYTQELIIGAEYELIPDLKVGLSYMHRSLPMVIEDISTNGGNTYLITNPGQNFDAEAANLRAESDRLLAQGGCMSFDDTSPNCDPSLQALAELQANRALELDAVKRFDKPIRNYDALIFQVVQRPTRRSLLQASYTYSVSKGNYPGLFSTETGQLDPNLTSLYDLADLMANRYGPMGLDRPHNLKIDGFYQFDLKKAGVLTTGASFRAISGIAHNALAAHELYGRRESYLLPRGSMPRSPVTYTTDVHLSYGYRVNPTTTVEGFVRIFNLFNSQSELNQDEEYTFDAANPVVGGDANDLKHVKTLNFTEEQNLTPILNPNYGNLNARQAPTSVQLGFRVTF